MAIVQEQTKFATGTSTGPTVTFDSTPTEGNLLLWMLACGAYITVAPSGWTAYPNYQPNNTAAIYYKISEGDESGAVSCTVNENTYHGVSLLEYSGLSATPADQNKGNYATTKLMTLTADAENAEAESLCVVNALWFDDNLDVVADADWTTESETSEANWQNQVIYSRITSALETPSIDIEITNDGDRDVRAAMAVFSASGSGGGPTELVRSVGTGADDGHIDDTTFYNAGDNVYFGNYLQDGAIQHMFFRFDNITVPIGATIDSAYLSIYFNTRYSGTDDLDASIYAEDDADADTYANYTAWTNRVPTTATVLWTLDDGGWTDNTYYDSPDLKTIITEIISLGGWASGNAILLYLEDEGPTPGGNEAEFEAYEGGNAAYLTITYSTSTGSVMAIFMQLIAG